MCISRTTFVHCISNKTNVTNMECMTALWLRGWEHESRVQIRNAARVFFYLFLYFIFVFSLNTYLKTAYWFVIIKNTSLLECNFDSLNCHAAVCQRFQRFDLTFSDSNWMWTPSYEKGQYATCGQCSSRSACASAQSDMRATLSADNSMMLFFIE